MRYKRLSFVLLGIALRLGLAAKISTEYGIISTDSFPQPYKNNVNKTWTITVENGYYVRLFFTVFDLEDSYEEGIGACAYDFVQVDKQKRLCGSTKGHNPNAPRVGQVFRSPTNTMTVNFVSDYSNEQPHYGFQGHYRAEDMNECAELKEEYRTSKEWESVLICDHFCHNVPASYYCSCRHGFTLHSDKHTCIADCKPKLLTGSNGSISTSEYPKAYSKLADCTQTIDVGRGRTLEIRFDEVFDVEKHYEENCVYDWVQLTIPGQSPTKYCGSSAPFNGTWKKTESSSVTVEFHSDRSDEKCGFKLYYKSEKVKCNSRIVSSLENGEVLDKTRNRYHEHGDVVTFKCNRGYRLIGSKDAKCDDGLWNNPLPTCQIKSCPRPEHLLTISNTVVKNRNNLQLVYNSTVTVTCVQWYGINSGSSEWFCDDDETWQPRNRISVVLEDNLPRCAPECGVKNKADGSSNLEVKGLILGGRFSRFGEWPWMAFLDLKNAGLDSSQFCGGSLVHERYVVTAAHCVQKGVSQFHIYLGVTDRGNSSNRYMQVFSAEEVFIHQGFVKPNMSSVMDHDIAVIKLNKSAVMGKYVRPVCIPRSGRQRGLPELGLQDSNEFQERGVVAGWGITEFKTPSLQLKQVRVPYYNITRCRTLFRRSKIKGITITDNMMCAGFLYKQKDACFGDSGGPLMWRDLRTHRWFLNGIVSFGTSIDCHAATVLGVYIRVDRYLRFLDENMI